MKKLLAIVLAFSLLLALGVPALATENDENIAAQIDDIEAFVESQRPLKELTLGVAARASGTSAAVSFTPAFGGYFDITTSPAAVSVYDQDFKQVAQLLTGALISVPLLAGKTYYIVVELAPGGEKEDLDQVDLRVRENIDPGSSSSSSESSTLDILMIVGVILFGTAFELTAIVLFVLFWPIVLPLMLGASLVFDLIALFIMWLFPDAYE